MAEIFFILTIVIFCIDWIFDNYKTAKKEREYKIKQIIATEMYEIDNMSGKEFEKLLLILFEIMGYPVEATPGSQDYGADLILYKNGLKIVVQAKRYKSHVGVKAIQEIVASVKYYKADKAMVITNSRYTENAYILARCNSVELWDRVKLMDLKG